MNSIMPFVTVRLVALASCHASRGLMPYNARSVRAEMSFVRGELSAVRIFFASVSLDIQHSFFTNNIEFNAKNLMHNLIRMIAKNWIGQNPDPYFLKHPCVRERHAPEIARVDLSIAA